jgi:hypothetical protein
MSPRGADAFERVLIWYPKWWREANADVLLGSMRDHAEHEGRSRPSRGETFSAFVNGVALHLDARVALWSSVVALVLSSGVWMLGLRDTYAGLATTGIAPVLTLVGVVALLRSRGWATPLRSLVALVVLVGALILAALAQLSWARGFALADAGVALSGLAAMWAPLVVGGWAVGGAGLALILDGALTHTRMPQWGRAVLAVVAGAVTAPVLGAGLISPVMSSSVAAVVAVVALRVAERPLAARARTPESSPSADSSPRPAQWLAWSSVAGGLVGLAYALTGSTWSVGATDSTVAMGHGITLSLAASIPLFAATGLCVPKRRGRIVVWGPLCVAVLAVAAVAVAYVFAPEWERMESWMTLSASLGGVALGWWVTPRLRGPLAARAAVGLAVGVAYMALVGITVIPSLALAVSVMGFIVAIRARRGVRVSSSHASNEGPASAALTA